MVIVPIRAAPSQIVSTVVGGQRCQINLYQNVFGLFFDLRSNGVDIVNGVLCQDANPLVPILYVGFLGNFIIMDTLGKSDPTYDGLGVRYLLVYLTAGEYAEFYP